MSTTETAEIRIDSPPKRLCRPNPHPLRKRVVEAVSPVWIKALCIPLRQPFTKVDRSLCHLGCLFRFLRPDV
jgi:hypothetical protein